MAQIFINVELFSHLRLTSALRKSQISTLPYSESDQLSFSHARSVYRAPDFRFSQDCTVVNVPCQGQSSIYASTNNASEENALSLLASAANLLSDNSRVLNLIDIRLRQQETDALILRHKRQTTNV